MLKRLLVGIAAGATVATTMVIGSASVAQAKCLDAEGKAPHYCIVSRTDANVWVTFVNQSDRLVGLGSLAGLDLKNEQLFQLQPGQRAWLVGRARSGEDVLSSVGWCPTATLCGTWIRARMDYKNPSIGYPWVRLDGAKHRFAEGEGRYLYAPFERGGKKGVATFYVHRVKDYEGGAKHFTVHFSVQAR